MLETSDRLMLYQGEPIKPTRCCFDHSCHDPFPRGPMKNAFSIRALTERWRRCNRQSIRCTCITRLRLNSSMAAPASILRCCAAAACCCFLCYCSRGRVCCQLLVPLVFIFVNLNVLHIATGWVASSGMLMQLFLFRSLKQLYLRTSPAFQLSYDWFTEYCFVRTSILLG